MTESQTAVRPERRAELAAGLARVRARIADACAAAGRQRDAVTLVAVTKTYPASDVVALAALGVTDVGENRDQEAAPKAEAVAGAGAAPRWHFIGQLQRNKARSVVRYADVVQSVDSVRLAAALDAAAGAVRDRPLDVLVQVSIDGDPARGGALPGAADPQRGLDPVAAAVAGADGLRLAGLMAVAPLGWEPDRAFARLAEVAAALRADHPGATVLSAGMSGDLESAIGHGATHVRVGSALLGMRPALR
ncbi:MULTISPECIES: YggS family pyridoxal phosphate-dependent enzyme [Micromonospora]|uniref:YggS family pyridoxal phosphate-dependent enzyme n=1 Tax=Micromonospora TaxID=1873 RepID=UPI0003EEAD63|nr:MULTISPECIES: YggS family pyridoxal phosphate-dependent enzyme [unclassified Micromonospora]EWM68527.1 pyridoxal phosphate enzyme, YggS family [Micromonospora sp. M42]MBP1784654.1 pyridoxal phosphate enzyme (YggS family) [Micromonospora sp. HB375]MCK1806263.1 YggS family pyridoxal phosphate-dependent enzyme [Micromonospora sp. R42106]MCK1831016.1 YggS family pyridoxal phosphate-dependent enzyme [Micromonospora sp. R42003]MCK1842502.1 YggS family pyridoxal phosphate-dependent enzyme [Micromo